MGVLLGGFIEGDPGQARGRHRPTSPSSRPGMVAAQAMTTVFGEVTYPVMGDDQVAQDLLRDDRDAARASRDVVLAHLGFVLFRVATDLRGLPRW